MTTIRAHRRLIAVLAGLLAGAPACGGDQAAGPSPARADAATEPGPATDAGVTPAVPLGAPAGDGGGPAGSLCERACMSTGRPACPAALTFADCVAGCERQLSGRCADAITGYLGCLAALPLEQLECDEAGAPRAKPPTCAMELVGVALCLAGP